MKPTPGPTIDEAITHAMSWSPSENGDSYAECRREVENMIGGEIAKLNREALDAHYIMTAQQDELARLRKENADMLGALRRWVIVRHIRLASDGGEIPNGGSCELCRSEWGDGQTEWHDSECLLAKAEASSILAAERQTALDEAKR